MAALADHFTVAQLATYSGVKETTVRTILSRESRLVQEIGKGETQGRGGIPKVYQLAPGAREEVLEVLRTLEAEAADVSGARPALEQAAGRVVPRALRAALDVLLFRLPRSRTDEWADLIDLASVSLSNATRDRMQADGWLPGTPAHAYLSAAHFLLDLAVAERTVVEAATVESPFHALGERLSVVVDEAREAGEVDLAEAVIVRFEGTHPTELAGTPMEAVASSPSTYDAAPPMTAYRQDGQLVVEFDLPAVDRGSIQAFCERNFLTVEAQRSQPAPDGSVLLVSERPGGKYRRKFFVDDSFDLSRAAGAYQDGVLTVRIPVVEPLPQAVPPEASSALPMYRSSYAAPLPVAMTV
ncbi:Hsp20 family protein [Streptomyces sp. bgisy153]|uniref:Hsp20 family protein n=1 Tax=Streptomyces sp. bgisy153 TaxID=3413793 RepID=UPI003D75B48C